MVVLFFYLPNFLSSFPLSSIVHRPFPIFLPSLRFISFFIKATRKSEKYFNTLNSCDQIIFFFQQPIAVTCSFKNGTLRGEKTS